ncbi:hypothetical protein JST97_24830 [bacterium]|nr:hypothetical protein [bacterium]
MPTPMSLSQEISRCRELLQISQSRMAQLVSLKTTRLSDLEKARSLPSEAEAKRLRYNLKRIVEDFHRMARSTPSLLADPRLRSLRERGFAG